MATQRENYPMVSVTKIVSVYPKNLHPQNLLTLSNLDRQCPVHMYLVFFYNPSHHLHQTLSVKSLFGSLKTSLEETLSVWYPAAGRLTLNPNHGKLDLLCDNSGAILVEAVTKVKISELGDLSQYNEFYEKLIFKPVFNGNFSEMPLVVAQVTKFQCGGYAVGVGTSHSLFDGPSTYNFLTSWASRASMRADGGLELIQPVHERGRLLVGHSRPQHQLTKFSNQNRIMTRVAAFDHLHQLIEQLASKAGVGGCKFSEMGSSNQENYVLKTFHVSSAMIEILKSKISDGKNGSTGHACSSFEVVAAHLWKTRTKALGLRKERMVCLQFAVDTRNKIMPSLSRGFSGNAYVLASITCTAGELEEQNHEAIVDKIKEAKTSLNEDYVNAYLEALEAPQVTLPPLRELTLVSDWTRMPFHKVNFGHGQATYASPLVPPLPQIACFMQSPNESSAIDLRIGLLPNSIHAFTHYFFSQLQ